MGLLGRPVSVQASDAEGKPVIVTRQEGLLTQGSDVSVISRADAEARFFTVTSEPADEGGGRAPVAGFLLHKGSFRGGQREQDRVVRFLQGGVLVTVHAED